MKALYYSIKDYDVKRDGNDYHKIQNIKSTLNQNLHYNEQQFFLC